MEQKPKFRYVKRIVLYVVLSIISFVVGMWQLGLLLLGIAAGFAILSYVQKDKMYLSEEEAAAEYAKYKRNEKKKQKKEEKKSQDDALDEQLQKIEDDFDFDYDAYDMGDTDED